MSLHAEILLVKLRIVHTYTCRIIFRTAFNVPSYFGARSRGTELQGGRSQDQYPMGYLRNFIDLMFPAALWPWGRISP